MNNFYKDFQSASESNWSLLKEMFGESKKFKLIKPERNNSGWDGMLITEKNGNQYVIIVEVKRRQFASSELKTKFNDTFFLEKTKYKTLHDRKKKLEAIDPTRNVTIWYLSKTSDGVVYIYNITNKKYKWEKVEMNEVTYTENQNKVNKLITKLPSIEAFFIKKTNILN